MAGVEPTLAQAATRVYSNFRNVFWISIISVWRTTSQKLELECFEISVLTEQNRKYACARLTSAETDESW